VTSYVLIDSSGAATVTSGRGMDQPTLAAIAAACQIQLNRDFAASYGGAYRVRAGSSPTDIAPGEIVFALLATLPDAPSAIAYHATDGSGVAVLYDGVALSDTLTGAGNSVSCAISHELLETAADPGCNRWADDGTGQEHAFEVCDPCESDTYELDGTGVYVSDFVLPAYWAANHAGPYSLMSLLGQSHGPPRPMSLAVGGYGIERQSGLSEHQVTASSVVSVVAGLAQSTRFRARVKKRAHFSSRAYRRGLRGG
jgi:hypothetical protein